MSYKIQNKKGVILFVVTRIDSKKTVYCFDFGKGAPKESCNFLPDGKTKEKLYKLAYEKVSVQEREANIERVTEKQNELLGWLCPTPVR